MRTHLPLTAVALLLAATLPGSAANPAEPPAERPGRYIMQPVDGGALRMDSETGAMSLCTRRNGAFACEPVQDERTSQKETERLTTENRDLKAEIKRLEEMLGLGEKPQAGNPPGRGPGNQQSEERPVSRSPKFELPTEEDLDKALSYAERMLKKFREKWKDIERGTGNGRDL